MVVAEGGARRSDLFTARVRTFGESSAADALGIFRIPQDAVRDAAVDPELAPALQSFLPRLGDGDALSRGERYYDVRSALLAWPALLAACHRLSQADEHVDGRITQALHENLFNVVAAMTFAYWERCCDEPGCVEERGPVLASLVSTLPEIAGLHLGAALGRDVTGTGPTVDWDLLESVGTRFPRRWPLRTLREFDSKPRVLDEARYLGHEVRARWPFQTVLFPLYGALTLAAYFRAVDGIGAAPGEVPAASVLIRLGFYERGESSFRTPHGLLDVDRLLPRPWLDEARREMHGRTVLVVDDNAATGRTLRACREFVLQCGGTPVTRSAETSWERLDGYDGDGPCFDGVDLPGLRSNMSYALHRGLVELLLRRRWDLYAERIGRLAPRDFGAGVLENVRAARRGGPLLARQRSSVEHEYAHARRHWREPGYPSAVPTCDGPVLQLPYEGYPDGVAAWSLVAPREVSGDDGFVLAAGSTNAVRLAVPGPGRLRLRLGVWSSVIAIGTGGTVDVEVVAPLAAGGHELVTRFSPGRASIVERRYPVHVVVPTPVSGSVRLVGGGATAAAIRLTGVAIEPGASSPSAARPDVALVIGEGALDPPTGALLRTALADGATALVLAQEPPGSAELPFAACLEAIPLGARAPVRFTTGHPALASLPRHRVLSFEDAAMLPTTCFTRFGDGPWASAVALGVLALDGSVRGTVVGAHDVGRGRLIVCQLRLALPAAAGHPGAAAVLSDLLRWATTRRKPFTREDVTLPDGRSMTYYPFPGADE